MRDTIYAPATASGRAAIAVVRVSGPEAAGVLRALCGRLPPARRMAMRKLRQAGEVLDEAVVVWMPGPRSYTGEDAGELQVHGGPAVVGAVCRALAEAGARLAEPGEFTRRAFEVGRLDLTQAEAIADLIDAETEAQRRQATAQLSGALSAKCRSWQDRLLDALASIEAGIDFPEDDVPGGLVPQALRTAVAVHSDIGAELLSDRGEQTRSGLKVAIVGAPNVGKSSLLNALAGRDAAIVTAREGTTRDVIEVHLVMKGHAVSLLDTAGLRETEDAIETEGVARARRSADQADLRVAVGDVTRPLTMEVAQTLMRSGDILVGNKIDIAEPTWRLDWPMALGTSAETGGVDSLRTALSGRLEMLDGGADFPAVTRQRHRDILIACRDHLSRIGERRALPVELAGEDLRLALRELERMTGRLDPEAVLDRVFSSFCIGK